MNGRAPNSPLTGSHALPTKNFRPNFASVSCECVTNSTAMRPTMAKMLSAHSSISQRKVESAIFELPRLCRNVLIADAGAGTATGTGPPSGMAEAGASFGVRGS